MEDFTQFDPRKSGQAGVDVPNKTKFMSELGELLKEHQSEELIGTFQAGAIPIILDTLARDTSDRGQKIVESLYKIIEDLKKYYVAREKKDEVTLPVEKAKPEGPT